MKGVIFLTVLAVVNLGFSKAYNISDVEHQVITGSNRFALELYKTLGGREGNIFFSPFSVSTCLAIVYLMGKGEMADQVAGALHLTPSYELISQGFHDTLQLINRGSSSVSWANKAFVEESFQIKPTFIDHIKKYFNAELGTENFKEHHDIAQEHIKEWISETTHGRITDFLSSDDITENTKMVLLSTIYFKGKWHHSIRPEETRVDNFYYANSKFKNTEMMTLRGNFGYSTINELNVKVLLIPYKDFKQNMIIILPNEIDGLLKLEENLKDLDFTNDIMTTLHYTTLEAIIPKFKFQHEYELKSPLQNLGIETIFNSELSDFTNAVNKSGLAVTSFQHKTLIEVNEEGTFASAATGAVLSERADVHEVPVFIADHPFIFAITDGETKSILFFGRYSLPV